MINLRNVSFPTMIAGGGALAAGLPFASMLITHPIAGGVYLVLGGALVTKVQQHSADKREAKAAAKAVEAAAKAQAEHEREVAEFMAQNAPQALPKPTTVINYEQAGQAVTRRV